MCEGLLTDGLSCGDPAGDQSQQPGVTRPPWDPALGSSHTKGPSTCRQEVPFEREDLEDAWRRKRSPTGTSARGPQTTRAPGARSRHGHRRKCATHIRRTGTGELTAEPRDMHVAARGMKRLCGRPGLGCACGRRREGVADTAWTERRLYSGEEGRLSVMTSKKEPEC